MFLLFVYLRQHLRLLCTISFRPSVIENFTCFLWLCQTILKILSMDLMELMEAPFIFLILALPWSFYRAHKYVRETMKKYLPHMHLKKIIQWKNTLITDFFQVNLYWSRDWNPRPSDRDGLRGMNFMLVACSAQAQTPSGLNNLAPTGSQYSVGPSGIYYCHCFHFQQSNQVANVYTSGVAPIIYLTNKLLQQNLNLHGG